MLRTVRKHILSVQIHNYYYFMDNLVIVIFIVRSSDGAKHRVINNWHICRILSHTHALWQCGKRAGAVWKESGTKAQGPFL